MSLSARLRTAIHVTETSVETLSVVFLRFNTPGGGYFGAYSTPPWLGSDIPDFTHPRMHILGRV